MLKLRQLEHFRAVMMCGSINKAASYLSVSQPVVSKTISQIERSTGISLFVRRGSSLAPTENAYILNRYCDEIFEKNNQLNSAIQNIKAKNYGLLKFGASPALCNSLIPKIISRYKPRVNIHFDSLLLKDVPACIESGFYDFSFSVWPIASDKLDCAPIVDSEFVFLCHKNNPLRKNGRIKLSDLANEKFIFTSRNGPIGAYIERQFLNHDVTCNNYIEVDRSDIVCSMINEDCGVSIINIHAFDPNMWRNVVAMRLDISLKTSIFLVTPKIRTMSAECHTFINFFKSQFDAESSWKPDF